ncbi:MAG: hypothetical protein Q8P59_13670, partial [Dehalococcoidia bacterium]|nr:hypothetical protein [Dehalococcoidia bacterium]
GLFSPSFALDDPRLGIMIKGLGIAFEVLTWLVIFVWARRWRGFRAASLVTLAYAWNPALVFDVAYWGQPDSIHSFFILLSILLLVERKPKLSWLFLAAAAFVKPQAWVFLPLVALLTLWRSGPRALGQGIAVGLGTSLVLVAPFLLQGTFRELMSLPRQVYGAMPFLSSNAHNLWWLYSSGPPFIADDGMVDFLSYRNIGFLLLGASYGFALWRTRGRLGGPATLGVAAFVGFSFFMLPTRVHENHMFMVFPLLALALAGEARLRWVYGILSVTFLANMALHDPPLAAAFWMKAAQPYWEPLQVANSILNTAALLAWALALRGKGGVGRQRRQMSETAQIST